MKCLPLFDNETYYPLEPAEMMSEQTRRGLRLRMRELLENQLTAIEIMVCKQVRGGRSFSVVANALMLSRTTVRDIYNRALEKLKAQREAIIRGVNG